MFTGFFFLLRTYGVPVTLTEWLVLMQALAKGLALSNLNDFYALARSVLVKSETHRPVRSGVPSRVPGH